MNASNPKRRVAVFRNNFLPFSETFIHDELRFHERYEAVVMACRHRNMERFPGHEVVAIETIPGRRNHLQALIYSATARSSVIDKAIANGGFDLIHAHFGISGAYAMGFAKKSRLPLVVSLHGSDVTALIGKEKYRPYWWLYLRRYKKLFEQAALFLAASSELKELIVGLGCPAEKVTVFRLGIDLEVFTPTPEKSDEANPTVVMVGRFVEKKGHEFGMRAFAHCKRQIPSAKLVIAGDGPLKSRYVAVAKELGIEHSVSLPGPLSPAGVRELIQKAKAVLAPSITAKNLDRESGMIVAKEASACGIPVIGSLHGGIPDIIDNNVTGYLVKERDFVEMGERLTQLLSDAPLRLRMGIAAREKMVQEYDIKQRISVLEDIYDSVVESSRSTGSAGDSAAVESKRPQDSAFTSPHNFEN
jgi:colanic acid/amylovoran biosynthesis glycosyltransferase